MISKKLRAAELELAGPVKDLPSLIRIVNCHREIMFELEEQIEKLQRMHEPKPNWFVRLFGVKDHHVVAGPPGPVGPQGPQGEHGKAFWLPTYPADPKKGTAEYRLILHLKAGKEPKLTWEKLRRGRKWK